PSAMDLLLTRSPRSSTELIYLASYAVIKPGSTALEPKQLLSERQYRDYYEKHGNTFTAKMGAEAIKELLQNVDLDEELSQLRKELESATGRSEERRVGKEYKCRW